MTIKTTPLAGDRVLVSGKDAFGNKGREVLHIGQWLGIKARAELAAAHEKFDDKVASFFGELTDAIAELESAHTVELDPLLYVVEQEGVEATEGTREVVTTLDRASVIMRALEQGLEDRLIWAAEDRLEVTAAGTKPTV